MKKMAKSDKEDLQAKLEEMRKERVDFQEEMKKIMLNMKTSVDENINKVTCKKEEQTGEMADFKEKVNR